MDKLSRMKKLKNTREANFRESLFSKISWDKLLRKKLKIVKFGKVCLAKVSTKVIGVSYIFNYFFDHFVIFILYLYFHNAAAIVP